MKGTMMPFSSRNEERPAALSEVSNMTGIIGVSQAVVWIPLKQFLF